MKKIADQYSKEAIQLYVFENEDIKDYVMVTVDKRGYLDINITESERLAELSTNVLKLSRVEAIEIIADKTPFLLDEQVRRVIALTEAKWFAKELVVNIEMEEVLFNGNEELTKQIWH